MPKRKPAPEGMRYCMDCDAEGITDGFRPLSEFSGPFTDPRYKEPRYSHICKRHDQARRSARIKAQREAGIRPKPPSEKQRAANRRYWQRNPHLNAANSRKWRERHPEEAKRRNAKWQRDNPVMHSMRQLRWRQQRAAREAGVEMPEGLDLRLRGRKPLRALKYFPTNLPTDHTKENPDEGHQ